MTSSPLLTNSIPTALEKLLQGGLVAFPTETVFGLGADATSDAAIKRLYTTKGRPTDHPVIVHLASQKQLLHWGRDIPAYAIHLAEAFWPGPLTLILKRQPQVSPLLTGGQWTVGLRVPSHPVAQAFLTELAKQFPEKGIAAPSANRFGKLSPTTTSAVLSDFGSYLDPTQDAILEGNPCEVGLESTIVDCTGEQPRILRPGMILPEDLRKVLRVRLLTAKNDPHTTPLPKTPGNLPMHYAPETPIILVPSDSMAFRTVELYRHQRRLGVLALRDDLEETNCFSEKQGLDRPTKIQAPTDPKAYAQTLYQNLRTFDELGLDLILVEEPPATEEWEAIHDRLQRAQQVAGPL